MTRTRLVEIGGVIFSAVLVAYFCWIGRQVYFMKSMLSTTSKQVDEELPVIREQVFNMKGELSSVSSEISATSQRVDRIANVLPDIGVKIAREEVSKPFEVAVVTTEPRKGGSVGWVGAVHVVDNVKKLRITYIVKLKGQDDESLACIVMGATKRIDSKAASFCDYESWSSDIKESIKAPSYVDTHASFVFRKSSPEYTEALKVLETEPKLYHLTCEVESWNNLAKCLNENPEDYTLE